MTCNSLILPYLQHSTVILIGNSSNKLTNILKMNCTQKLSCIILSSCNQLFNKLGIVKIANTYALHIAQLVVNNT